MDMSCRHCFIQYKIKKKWKKNAVTIGILKKGLFSFNFVDTTKLINFFSSLVYFNFTLTILIT
eukprot:SAG22_NODE_76_length_22248_cov_14.352070_3_plen_63_part_00